MPQRTKKDHKCSHHTERGSRWHNIHFSGKVIVCSVILGFMLILVGGILMAIGMDSDEETKSDNYDDLQKKPPMVFVGPAIMGIGGFAVIVGVLMCLIETKVCRKRNADSSPLITTEGEQTEVKEVVVNDSEAAAIPSTSRQHRDRHRNGARKKSSSPRKSKGSKKPHSSREKYQSSSPSSPSDADGSKSSKYLTASDTFLTPPNSFTDDVPEKHCNKENQTTSLMQSFLGSGKSWSTSAELQTPSASFVDDPLSLQFADRKEEEIHAKENHKFVTPQNSDAGILSNPLTGEEKEIEKPGNHLNGNRKEVETTSRNNHKFVTPQNSDAGILSIALPNKEKEIPGPGNHLGGDLVSQNTQEVLISSEVQKTEDISHFPASQTKPGDPKDKSLSSDEIQNTGRSDNPKNLRETDKTEMSCVEIESGATSSEKNEKYLKDNSDDVDELENKNIEENIAGSVKNLSSNDIVKDYQETSSSNTSINSLEENTEDPSQLNSSDIDSANAHLDGNLETASTNVDIPEETINTPT